LARSTPQVSGIQIQGLVQRLITAAQSMVMAPTRRVRLIVVALVLLLYVAWSVFVVAHDRPLDFWLYYIAAPAMRQGVDVYQIPQGDPRWETLAQPWGVPWYAPPYRYPPLTAILVMPLTLLTPPHAAALVFLLASTLALVASALLLSDDSRPGYSSVAALAIVAFFVPAPTTFYAGQVNVFVLLTVALAVWAFRRGCRWLSGLALAIGTMLKVMPITLIAYALWRRQWALVGAALLGLTAIILIGLPVVGSDITISYFIHGPELGVEGVLNPTATNQSLQGLLGRLFTLHSYGRSLMDGYDLGLGTWYALVLLIGIATVLVCWPRGQIERFFDLEASLVIVTTFLVSPTAFNHHLVLLAVPFTVLAHRVLAGELPRWTASVAALAYVLIDVQGALWHQFADLRRTELLSLATYGMLMLWALLAWIITQRKFLLE